MAFFLLPDYGGLAYFVATPFRRGRSTLPYPDSYDARFAPDSAPVKPVPLPEVFDDLEARRDAADDAAKAAAVAQ